MSFRSMIKKTESIHTHHIDTCTSSHNRYAIPWSSIQFINKKVDILNVYKETIKVMFC